jgi:hypothetical protein
MLQESCRPTKAELNQELEFFDSEIRKIQSKFQGFLLLNRLLE